MSETPASLRPLTIAYSSCDTAECLERRDVLAVIDFGRGVDAPDDPRAIRVGLDPIGERLREIWTVEGHVEAGRAGAIRWAGNGEHGFVAIEIDESDAGGIEAAAEHAYRALMRFVAASAAPHVLRIWNYLDAINDGDGDDERYRKFCVGRGRGMRETFSGRYPAATAIGRLDGRRSLQVYALTARAPGRPVENPRQTSAWRYPREYGPTPPSFARGMVAPDGQVLISGTAAVVGAESRHRDDAAAQLDETLSNLSSLLRSADGRVAALGAGGLLKTYVRHPHDAERIRAALRARAPDLDGLLLLHGDICRRELLLEIDGRQA